MGFIENNLCMCNYLYPGFYFHRDAVIHLTKTTVVQNEDALSYLRVHGLNFQAVVFVRSIKYVASQVVVCSCFLYACRFQHCYCFLTGVCRCEFK